MTTPRPLALMRQLKTGRRRLTRAKRQLIRQRWRVWFFADEAIIERREGAVEAARAWRKMARIARER